MTKLAMICIRTPVLDGAGHNKKSMLLFSTMLPLPSAGELIASSTEWTSPLLVYLLPLIIVSIGVGLLIFVFKFLVGIFHK